jgi:hypothetical protein
MEIIKPNVAEKPKRKDGRPRKIQVEAPSDTVKEQFTAETITGIVETKHIRKPSQQKRSPFKLP